MLSCGDESIVSDTFRLNISTLVFQAGPLRQYENSPYAESNDAVHAGTA